MYIGNSPLGHSLTSMIVPIGGGRKFFKFARKVVKSLPGSKRVGHSIFCDPTEGVSAHHCSALMSKKQYCQVPLISPVFISSNGLKFKPLQTIGIGGIKPLCSPQLAHPWVNVLRESHYLTGAIYNASWEKLSAMSNFEMCQPFRCGMRA